MIDSGQREEMLKIQEELLAADIRVCSHCGSNQCPGNCRQDG
jgi:hypothetical protein